MTDPSDVPRSAGESPETAEVRRLLAAARHTEPMPPEVASRLDDVLAGLSREPPVERTVERTIEPSAFAPVVALATRRRLRNAGLLVAAAAVVVGGVAGVQHLPRAGDGGGAATAGADQGSGNQSLGNTGNPQLPHAEKAAPVRNGRVVVHAKTLTSDALFGRRLLARLTNDSTHQKSLGPTCTDVPRGARTVPAQYRHAPAVLVYRVPARSGQVVDLYVCGHAEPVRSITLPAP